MRFKSDSRYLQRRTRRYLYSYLKQKIVNRFVGDKTDYICTCSRSLETRRRQGKLTEVAIVWLNAEHDQYDPE